MRRTFGIAVVLMSCLLCGNLRRAAGAVLWSKEFRLHDTLQLCDFPTQLISYPVRFPANTVRGSNLRLIAGAGEQGETVPFQLSQVVEHGGFVDQATVSFRADLPSGGSRVFRLICEDQPASPPLPSRVGVRDRQGDTAVLAADLLRVKVPYGHIDFPGGKPLSETPAPLLALARAPRLDDWCGQGAFQAPADLRALSMQAGPVEAGSLFATYRVAYTLTGNRKYVVDLTLREAEKYLTVDEYLTGFKPADETYLRFDLSPGLDPDQRQVMSNGGYDAFSGAFDRGVGADGKLPFELGLYTPNSLGVMRAAAFWNGSGPNALLLALYRLRDWKTARRRVWREFGPGNLNFYAAGGHKYLQTRLEGQERHWAIALIPASEMVNSPRLTDRPHDRIAAGPEVRLWQNLADFNLNTIKDWVFDWDEKLTVPEFPQGKEITYEEWLSRYGLESRYPFLRSIVNGYWDFSNYNAPVSFRAMPDWFGDYARSRASWTQAQRDHVRSILLFMAYTSEDDNNVPHHSMLGGHPNFISDVKQTLPIACAVFQNHPDARRWRDSFLDYYKEWLDTYARAPDPEHNAIGGRWTENIACYSGQSLEDLLNAAEAMHSYDGTDLLSQPALRAWIDWYLNAMMAPDRDTRLVPPEGAHATSFEPGNRSRFRETLFEIARRMAPTAPELSAAMRWIETSGTAGTQPSLHTVLVRDYGPVLRYDFGGPHEAYAHLMQIAGEYNYRWGDGNGVLYYAARNRVWSYNRAEDNGDNFDINKITAFSVNGKGLGRHATDQPLFDFGFAQFYRAVADPEEAAKSGYLSRAVMMLRDDYLVVYDAVEGQAEGQFAWATMGEMPQIAQLKPGAAPEEEVTPDTRRDQSRPPTQYFGVHAKIRRYRGQGDFLTMVSPAPVDAKATPFGEVIGDEMVFCAGKPFEHSEAAFGFAGVMGYARPGQLALFEGTRIRLNGFQLEREGGDFGVSAALAGKQITGRFAGRSGGRVLITPPAGFDARSAKVTVEGASVPVTVENGAFAFNIEISLKDGTKQYIVAF